MTERYRPDSDAKASSMRRRAASNKWAWMRSVVSSAGRYPAYFREFVRGYSRYSNHKFPIKKLQIWVGQTCTLKCKNCSQLFPYIKPRIYDIDTVIAQTQKILQLCEVESFHIIGGEPFTHKGIGKLIEFVCQQKHSAINKIISNGTILPSDQTVEVLKRFRSDIQIQITRYDCAKERQEKFISLCVVNGIQYFYTAQEALWYYLGDCNQEEIKDVATIQHNFNACWDRTCTTLADGELSACPRMHNSSLVFGHSRPFIEHLKVAMLSNNRFSRALIATNLSVATHREACKFCHGITGFNKTLVKRGEQLD